MTNGIKVEEVYEAEFELVTSSFRFELRGDKWVWNKGCHYSLGLAEAEFVANKLKELNVQKIPPVTFRP